MTKRKKRNTRKKKGYKKRRTAATSKKSGACFVYVMKRTTNVSWYAWLTFQREYKIGVTNTLARRNREINNDIKGNVELLSSR